MKKAVTLFLLFLALCAFFAVSAFASSEPSAEPSDEPSGEASAEPSGEPSGEASAKPSGEPADGSFTVSFLVNGAELDVVSVPYTVEGNTYTFELAELTNLLGLQLSYDEESRTVTAAPAAPAPRGLLADVLERSLALRRASEDGARPAAESAREPMIPADMTIAEVRDRPVGDFFRKA